MLAAPPIDTLLLDFGHTLFDTASSPSFIVSWAAGHGSAISLDEATGLWEAARVASRTPEEFGKGRDRTPELHRACWTDLWSALDERAPGLADALYSHETGPEGWVPYADTRPFLEGAKERGLKIAIISDVAFALEPLLEHHGLDAFIDAFVLSYRHGALKADGPFLFDVALEALGADASAALMVGDNHVNDALGVTAGVRTFLLPHAPTGSSRGLASVLALVDGLGAFGAFVAAR